MPCDLVIQVILTERQQKCVEKALEGHTFLIHGQAGTGKSFTVCHLIKELVKVGKSVKLVCSTGIACEVYKEEPWPCCEAQVINSFLDMGIAIGPFDKIMKNSVSKCGEKLSKLDVVIWDEHAFDSSRILELISAICCKVNGNDRAFGGLQLILVGDWLQLTPVPDNMTTL